MTWPFNKGYKIVRGEYGNRMILQGPWSDHIEKVFIKMRVVELELNNAKGWPRSEISFVENLIDLLAFEIVDEKIDNIASINSLCNLRSLKVLTYCNSVIDFAKFIHLEKVSLEWRPQIESLYNCRTLKHVFVNSSPVNSLDKFGKLELLEYLSLKSPKLESIGDVNALQNLRFLGIYNAKNLSSLKGIEPLVNLEILEIERCRKISDIVPIKHLKDLRRLMIANCGNIESLQPVAQLKELREVFFHETTNILDGDLSLLKKLPNLQDVSFQERMHYNCKWDDLPMKCSKKELQMARELLKKK